jgi:hypothetical protein
MLVGYHRGMVLLLTLLLAADLSGTWVGPLELTDTITKARGPMPTRVTLTMTGDRLTGDWTAHRPNTSSGTITGTIDDKGRVRLSVTVYADGGIGRAVEEPERCVGEATFTGTVTASGILRLKAPIVTFNRPKVVADGRECANNLRELVWTLQRN